MHLQYGIGSMQIFTLSKQCFGTAQLCRRKTSLAHLKKQIFLLLCHKALLVFLQSSSPVCVCVQLEVHHSNWGVIWKNYIFTRHFKRLIFSRISALWMYFTWFDKVVSVMSLNLFKRAFFFWVIWHAWLGCLAVGLVVRFSATVITVKVAIDLYIFIQFVGHYPLYKYHYIFLAQWSIHTWILNGLRLWDFFTLMLSWNKYSGLPPYIR